MANLLAVTAMTPKVLASVQVAATTATTVYTVPALTTTIVKQASVCNTSASAVSVSVSVVPSGGAADGTHRVVSGYAMAANETLSLTGVLSDCCLGPGDFVSVTCSVGAVVDVVLTGVESA